MQVFHFSNLTGIIGRLDITYVFIIENVQSKQKVYGLGTYLVSFEYLGVFLQNLKLYTDLKFYDIYMGSQLRWHWT